MGKKSSGNFVTITAGGESYRAFVPRPLPPEPPPVVSPRLQDIIQRALISLGRLDSVSLLLPDTSIFLYSYVRKEAVISSQIEGTQSSLSDLLVFELEGTPGVPIDDVREVSNYVAALDHGLTRLRGGFPLSLRLLKEIHAILLVKGRGSRKTPGEFRRSQNWIGGTRPGNAGFVPPPPDRLMECLGDFELFLHDKPQRVPILFKAAYAHAQFETIHPFLDGNGRLGRLLITLLFCAEGVLREPLLYLSLYFKTHRQAYYDLLQRVRTDADWESWLEFFVTAVGETADKAVETADRLGRMAEKDRESIRKLGRPAGSALRVHQALLQRPVLSIQKVCEMTGLVPNTAAAAFQHLIERGLVKEITGQRRGRLFAYGNYLKLLGEGT